MKKQFLTLGLGATLALGSGIASAGLMLETYDSGAPTPDTLGGWQLTDIDAVGTTGLTSSITSSSFTGSIDLLDYNGDPLAMNRVAASDINSWWNNGESHDYDAFTTHVPLVVLALPENVRAITFNLGSNFNAGGWLMGYSAYQDTVYTSFNLNPDSTPGFGIYANNSGCECDSITRVAIDPIIWGFGNVSIAQSDQCTAEVPEPGVVGLLALGLAGLGIARSRANKV